MLKEKEKVVNNFLAFIDVIIAWGAINLALYLGTNQYSWLADKDLVIIHMLIFAIWFLLAKQFHLNELYRSRPYSIILFNCIGMSLIGSGFLGLTFYIFKLSFVGLNTLILFGIIDVFATFFLKAIIYKGLKKIRTQGINSRTIIIIGDESAATFINQINLNKEWGYRIAAIMGSPQLEKIFGENYPFLKANSVNLNQLIAEKAIDEVIYCYDKPNMDEVESLIFSCSEVGVVFRMYSPFFNMLTKKTYLHYFSTTPMITFSNTPIDYWELLLKRIFDIIVSLSVIILFAPVFVAIAILITISSKGPIFFMQKRVGIRGRKFWVYKFRTMVINAEALKHDLMEHNEMDGPVFKISRDPRITAIGLFLRKTSLDELPQFFNVLLGDMSIVGPRPPIPQEVKEYERWQLRRLSMKPGITCLWQIAPSRNTVSFEEWMKMDLQYIDNWSLKMDFVIVLKTVRTMLRADGK